MEQTYPSTLPRISPSSVNSLDCARRFHELYVKKAWPSREPVENVAHGTAVHEVLAATHRGGGKLQADNLEALARAATWKVRWPDGTDKLVAAQRVLSSALGFVAFDAENAPSEMKTLSVEFQAEFPVCYENVRFLVSAKIDKIYCRSRHLVARNYKTSRPRIDLKQAFLELWVAKKMFPGYDSYSLEYLFLDGDNNVYRETVTDRDLRGIHALVMRAAVAALSSPDHAPCPGDTYNFCPIRASCDARSVIGARFSVREA